MMLGTDGVTWPSAPLGSLVRVVGGGTPSKTRSDFWSGAIPWVSPKDMGRRELCDAADHITEAAIAESATQIVPAGSVLIVVRSGILVHRFPVSLTRTAVALNQDLKALLPGGPLIPEFLAYALEAKSDEVLQHCVKRGATVHSVDMGKLQQVRLPVPPPSEQHRLVEILDQADRLRRLRAEADAKADRILPALFIKMFGDPAANPMGWPRTQLADIIQRIDSGWSPVCEHRPASPDEWGVLKLGAVTSNRYIETENKALPTALDPRPELEVQSGDLLFTRKNTRELVGACAYVGRTRPRLLLSDLVFRLRLAADAQVHPLYMWALLTTPGKRSSIEVLAAGSAGSMPNISKGRLEGLEIEKPPYPLQVWFANAVGSVESLRTDIRLAQESIERSFAILLQRAFNGALTTRWRTAHMTELLQEMEQQAKALASPADKGVSR